MLFNNETIYKNCLKYLPEICIHIQNWNITEIVDNPALKYTFILHADIFNNLGDDAFAKNHLISVMKFGILFLKGTA